MNIKAINIGLLCAILVLVLFSAASAFAFVAGGCGTACWAERYNNPPPLELSSYFWWQSLVVLGFYISGYFLGRFVQQQKISASLSRKLVCLITFALSYTNSFSVPVGQPTITSALVALGGGIILLMLGSLAYPLRRRIPFLATVFASINRPEDEPYTLPWIATESVVTTAIILLFIPIMASSFVFLMPTNNVPYVILLIPIFASGIGDALAEIVGKRWGRHPYTTRSIFGKRLYTRTYEGSAMIFLTTVTTGLVIAMSFDFNLPYYFWVSFILLPITLTLAEAKAPHTWDNPFIYFVGYITILFSVWLI